MDDLKFRSRWVYNDGSAVDYYMSIPSRIWNPKERGFGGSEIAGSGVPAAYELRRDYFMSIVLRFPESERANVTRLIRHLQRAGSATWYPDQDEGGTAHAVYGHSPAMDEDVEPTRDPDEPSTLELAIVVRRTTQAEFTDAWF